MAALAVLLLVLLVFSPVHSLSGQCLMDGADGLMLDPYYDSNGTITCMPGFYCPNLDTQNTSTYPVYCPPLPDCALDRILGDECDDVQSPFEPQLCPKRYYCPTPHQKIRCPEGYFCFAGFMQPRKCDEWFGYCPEGSKRQFYYGSFIFFALSSIVVIVAVIVYRKQCLVAELEFGETTANSSSVVTPNTMEMQRTMSMFRAMSSPQFTSRFQHVDVLLKGFDKARLLSGHGNEPLTFQFDHLGVEVKLQDGTKKQLLRDVSGRMCPGKVTAILGPSGAGKTVFMNAMLGKVEDAWQCTGTVKINDAKATLTSFRSLVGFVPQDDVLHVELSAAKNIAYASELRLPSSWSSKERAEFRSSVIECLGLTSVKDIPVGNELNRGLDNGQRKRTSMGVELASAPLAMFLDEPTSGLDATTSLEICAVLREIADRTKLTVAMVIHQPRVEIWQALDEILLIGKGGVTVYQGPQQEAQEYFTKNCHVTFPPSSNPADVIIDAIGNSSETLAELWASHVRSCEGNNSPAVGQQLPSPVVIVDRSPVVSAPTYSTAPEATTSPSPPPAAHSEEHEGRSGAPLWRQIILAHNRHVEKQLGNLSSLYTEMIVNCLTGVVMGMDGLQGGFVHTGVYRQPYARISPIPMSALLPQLNMYECMCVGLAAATAGVQIFGPDRLNYYRGAAAGNSRVGYFLGTVLASVYRVLLCSLVHSTTYHGLGQNVLPFGVFFGVITLLYWATYAFAEVISMVASLRNAPLIACIGSIVIAIFNGYVDFPIWTKHISFAFYASETLHNEHFKVVEHVYQDTMSEWGYTRNRESVAMLLIFVSACVVHVIAFVLLVFINRNKQR